MQFMNGAKRQKLHLLFHSRTFFDAELTNDDSQTEVGSTSDTLLTEVGSTVDDDADDVDEDVGDRRKSEKIWSEEDLMDGFLETHKARRLRIGYYYRTPLSSPCRSNDNIPEPAPYGRREDACGQTRGDECVRQHESKNRSDDKTGTKRIFGCLSRSSQTKQNNC